MRSCRNLDPKDHSGKARVKLAVYTGKDGVAGKLSSRMEGRLSRAEETLASVKVEKRYDGDLWMRAEPSARKVLHRQPELVLALGERRLLVPLLSIGNTDHYRPDRPQWRWQEHLGGRGGAAARSVRAGARYSAGAHRRAVPRRAFSVSDARFAQSRAGAGGGRGAQFRSRSLGGRRANEPGRDAQAHARPRMPDAPELIIMDEPSNYLDLHSVEALERLLAAFPGALLLVSHDAALLEATTSVCWEISESSPETSILTVGWR